MRRGRQNFSFQNEVIKVVKINALKIDGFGVWNGLKIGGLSDQISVFYGLNEAGKTTLLEFLRSILYGFSDDRRRYLPPKQGGRPGGSMVISGSGGLYELERYDDLHDDNEPAPAVVLSPDGTRGGESTLSELLSGTDEKTFNRLFAIGLTEMQQLGTLSDTDAAALLFRLSAGLDRVSLVDSLAALEQSRRRLLTFDGTPCKIRQLVDRRDQLREEIDGFGQLLDRHARLIQKQESINHHLSELEENKTTIQREAQLLEAVITVRDPWRRRIELQEKIRSLQLPDRLAPGVEPDEMLARFRQIAKAVEKYQSRLSRIRNNRRELRSQAKGLKINRTLLAESSRIVALRQQADWIESLEKRIEELSLERADLARRLAEEKIQLGVDSINLPLSVLAYRPLDSLRRPARNYNRLLRQRSTAEASMEVSRAALADQNAEVDSLLAAMGETDLDEAILCNGNLVASLRRKIQLDERLAQLEQNNNLLEMECRECLNRQLMPVSAVVGLGLVFVTGIISTLAGLFLPISILGRAGWPLAFLGLIGTAAAATAKIMLERSGAARLAAVRQQLDSVTTQLNQVQSESRQLAANLQESAQPARDRLGHAEDRLKELEAIAPLDARRVAARREQETAERQWRELDERVEKARDRWLDAIGAIGLPESLSVKQIGRLVERIDDLVILENRIDRTDEEIRQRQSERDSLVSKVRELAELAKIGIDSDEPARLLQGLIEALDHNESLDQRRKSLRREDKLLARRSAKINRRIKKANRRRRELLARLQISDESQLEDRAVKMTELSNARVELAEVEATINATLKNDYSEEKFARLLEQSDESIEQQWDKAESDLAAIDERLAEYLQQKGEIRAEIKQLSDDRRPLRRSFDLAALEQDLGAQIRQWQVQTTVVTLLKKIKTIYEQTRQPETLQEASGYLGRMTLGRYPRVWTPLGEDRLYVDDDSGKTLTVEDLSRGTREQLFLALRLALVGSFARRGVQLPLILDDVLVNFDSARARATAEVMCDFTEAGHQLLLFTCHEHINEIFKNMGITVKQLKRKDQEQVVSSAPAERLPEPVVKKKHPAPQAIGKVVIEEEPPEDEFEEEVDGELDDDLEDEIEDELDDEEYEYEYVDDDEDEEELDDEYEYVDDDPDDQDYEADAA